MIYRRLFTFFLPLATSIVLMAIELTLVNAAIARMPNASLAIAALSVALAFNYLVEAPIYSMLQVSNALSGSLAAFRRLKGYTLAIAAALTAFNVLVVATPLYHLIFTGLMGAPADIVEVARPVYWVFTITPLVIGWRRVLQGAIIVRGHAGIIALGTTIRIVYVATGCLVIVAVGTGSAALLGALVIQSAIVIETLVVWLVSRRIVVQDTRAGANALLPVYRAIWQLHLPLILSTFMMSVARPITNAALARTTDPVLDLAAYAIMLSVLGPFLFPLMAIQQVYMTRAQEGVPSGTLRRFAVGIGVAASALVAILALTPLAPFVFQDLLGVDPVIAGAATAGLTASILMPLGRALQSLYQGKAVLDDRSDEIRLGTFVHLVVLVATLVPLVVLLPSGVVAGALAAVFAVAAEVVVLHARLAGQPAPALSPTAKSSGASGPR